MRGLRSFPPMISGMPSSKPAAGPRPPAFRTTIGAGVLVLVVLLLQVGGENVTTLLRYDRGPIEAGQLWRLVTAHLVHLGWGHAFLNATALALIIAGFGPVLRPAQWIRVAVTSALLVDIGLWFVHPAVHWYAGLSGVLHGLVAGAAVAARSAMPRLAAVILCFLSAKLLWEIAAGPLPLSTTIAATNVITQAHLWGAVGGALAAFLVTRRHTRSDPL